MSLKERIDSYQESTDYKILPKIPVAIVINGRGFSKVTSMLEKPHCNLLSQAFAATALKLCYEIDGAILSYTYNDEIIIILKNDFNVNTTPWYNNKIQKICSASASIATIFFNNYIAPLELNTLGDICFTSQIFCLPNNEEILNTIIYKQSNCYNQSIHNSCFYELLKINNNKNNVKNMLAGLTNEEKIDLLEESCNISFKDYPHEFKYGYLCYKAPKLQSNYIKYKWQIHEATPIFREDKILINNVISCGYDIFRSEK
jgi:tRNA(His) 5'-end guanylyltransferase